jgi:D-alanyl-D-alanine carboxypeptidase (penicillin-binding protein 5/6)
MSRKISRGGRAGRRKTIVRLRVLTLLLLSAGCVYGLYRLFGMAERPELLVDSVNYARMPMMEEVAWQNGGEDAQGAAETVTTVGLPFANIDDYPVDMPINSEYALVYDVTLNEFLYAKNADVRCYPASTTKILTAAVVLDYAGEDFEFTGGDELDFVNPGSSLAHVGKGNVLNTEMIIDALMLASGNDASYTAAANVGRFISGKQSQTARESVDNFIYAMNRTLRKIGASDTNFTNPDGFHDDDHYTTLYDMLKITLYAKDKPLLKESAKKVDRSVTYLSGETVYWENSNRLLNENNDIYYVYATGLKTGMTDKAGYCVVVTAERFEHEVICMVFGAPSADVRWNDAIALLDKAFVYIRGRD